MYNALFFSFNSKYTHAALAPWCLLAGTKKYCKSEINASVAEGTVNEREDDVLARIAAYKPDFIGFCTYIWNVKAVMSAAEKYKKAHPDTVIVLGGPEVSYNPEEILSAPYIDYVISGEGEQPCAVLLDSIVRGEDIPDGFGICTRERISSPFISCEEPPSPYCGEFFAALGSRIPYIE
ncbi:MAG: cobalamin-dependent protein, partial [Oscillospiraceae bacterium]